MVGHGRDLWSSSSPTHSRLKFQITAALLFSIKEFALEFPQFLTEWILTKRIHLASQLWLGQGLPSW